MLLPTSTTMLAIHIMWPKAFPSASSWDWEVILYQHFIFSSHRHFLCFFDYNPPSQPPHRRLALGTVAMYKSGSQWTKWGLLCVTSSRTFGSLYLATSTRRPHCQGCWFVLYKGKKLQRKQQGLWATLTWVRSLAIWWCGPGPMMALMLVWNTVTSLWLQHHEVIKEICRAQQ